MMLENQAKHRHSCSRRQEQHQGPTSSCGHWASRSSREKWCHLPIFFWNCCSQVTDCGVWALLLLSNVKIRYQRFSSTFKLRHKTLQTNIWIRTSVSLRAVLRPQVLAQDLSILPPRLHWPRRSVCLSNLFMVQ